MVDPFASTGVPEVRRRVVNRAPLRAERRFVLYWMIGSRRTRSNHAMDLAVDLAQALRRPLLVFEALRVGHPWACDRFHTFIIEGMQANAASLAGTGVGYFPYVEGSEGEGKGLLAALAEQACVVVTDDCLGFFQPRMLEAASAQVSCMMVAVDSAGLLPVRAPDRAFARAYDFRRYLQRELPSHLLHAPHRDPVAVHRLPRFAGKISPDTSRWPLALSPEVGFDFETLRRLPIDHAIGAAPSIRGGSVAAAQRLASFVADRLPRYAEARNHPDDEAGSGLSPYLHFGHLGAHEVFEALARDADWSPALLEAGGGGQKEGFWQLPPPHEAFLDEMVTWRELGQNFAAHRDDLDQYSSLPAWAQKTLATHARDPRPVLYDDETLTWGRTHDEVWNAAQNELRSEGRMHNYLRMLWGKKLLEWSESPRVALARMIELNNRFAIDGRDPNSYSGIFWVLGRYDRAWGPERPIYGTVRMMSSQSTRRKLRLRNYLARYGGVGGSLRLKL